MPELYQALEGVCLEQLRSVDKVLSCLCGHMEDDWVLSTAFGVGFRVHTRLANPIRAALRRQGEVEK